MSYGPSTSSGLLSASTIIAPRNAYLYSIEIVPPSTGISKVEVFDSKTATSVGKIALGSCSQYAGESSKPVIFPMPVNANEGLYAVLSGTATSFIIHWAPA